MVPLCLLVHTFLDANGVFVVLISEYSSGCNDSNTVIVGDGRVCDRHQIRVERWKRANMEDICSLFG